MAIHRYALECVLPVSRERAWEVLANTDRLNQKVGLPPVVFATPLDDVAQDGYEYLGRQASARLLGVPLQWTEYPFEWVRGESYSVMRSYQDGVLREFRGGVRLCDEVSRGEARGTRAQLWAEVEPRSAGCAPLVSLLVRQTLRKTRHYCEGLCVASAATMHNAREATPRLPAYIGIGGGAQLKARLRDLEAQQCSPQLVQHLESYLREATDNEVCNIRPYELAERWGLERDDVLRACLQGAHSGLLALSWNLMCPNCRVSKASYGSLGSVESRFHCDWCGIGYDTDFGRSVELRFAVHPAVRRATPHVYCTGSPAHSPHVLAQVRLEAGEATTFALPRAERALRLRVLRANHTLTLSDTPNSDVATVVYGADGWKLDVGHPEIAGGETPSVFAATKTLAQREAVLPALHLRGRVEARNASQHDIVVVLERETRDEHAVTAARVSTMPEFRAQFGTEVLSPGVQVRLESTAVLFSDLRGSTAFYEQAGDALAYGRVRDHFEILTRCVNEHGGAVVKTMGDAVMAVFTQSGDAVRAALCMQESLQPWLSEIQQHLKAHSQDDLVGDKPALKIGIHCGPVIVVNTDGHLDYFGRTVNLAARLQHISTGNDTVISQACRSEAETDAQAASAMSRAYPHQQRVNLRGFEESCDVWRLRITADDTLLEQPADFMPSFDPHVFDAMLDALQAA